MIRLGIADARSQFSELVNRVAFGGQRVVITSRGSPKAILLGWTEFQRLSREGRKLVQLGGLWKGGTFDAGSLEAARRRWVGGGHE